MEPYRVKNPNIPKLNTLARLAFNSRYWAIEFKKDLGEENHRNMEVANEELDKWLKENIEPVEKKQ